MLITASYQGFFAANCVRQSVIYGYFSTSEKTQELLISSSIKKTDSANSLLFEVKDRYFSGRKHTIEEIIRDIKADQK
jgi:hypothetical protein